MTPETHKYAVAARSFCCVTTENGKQQDIYNFTIMPCVQRSLYLKEMTNNFGDVKVEVPERVDSRTRDVLERCMTTCGRAAGMRAKKRSRVRKEASVREVQGYYKQFAEATHLEYKSWIDNEVFDLVDLRKTKPRNFCDRKVGAHHQDGQTRQLPQDKSQMGTEKYPRQTKGISTNGFTFFHKTRISDELPDGSQQELEHLSH